MHVRQRSLGGRPTGWNQSVVAFMLSFLPAVFWSKYRRSDDICVEMAAEPVNDRRQHSTARLSINLMSCLLCLSTVAWLSYHINTLSPSCDNAPSIQFPFPKTDDAVVGTELRERAQTSAKASNPNQKWFGIRVRISGLIQIRMSACWIAPKMLWIYYRVSHFAECRQNQPLRPARLGGFYQSPAQSVLYGKC